MVELLSNFKQLINQNPNYAKAIAKNCGLDNLPIDVTVGGMFRSGRFIFPPFVGFESAELLTGKPADVYYIRCLNSPRPKISMVYLLRLRSVLSKVDYKGIVLAQVNSASFSLPKDNHPFARLFKFGTRKDLGYKIVTSKQWLCLFNNKFGEGTSPTIALRQCGGSGEVSSRYIRLRKEHLI